MGIFLFRSVVIRSSFPSSGLVLPVPPRLAEPVEHRAEQNQGQHHGEHAEHALPHIGQSLQKQFHIQCHGFSPLPEKVQNDAARDDRGDLPRDVRARGVHEQKVLPVLLLAHLVDDPRRHGEGRDAGRTDHRIDLVLREEVEHLGEDHAARRVRHERDKAEPQDEQRARSQKSVRRHLYGDRQAQQQRNEVGQHLLGCLGQRVQHAAFPQQIAEHQETDERRRARSQNARNKRNKDREQNLRELGDPDAGVLHADPPFLFCRKQTDDRRLDDRHQRHIGIGCNDDRPQIGRVQEVGHKDGGRAVRRADDRDGGRVADGEAQKRRQAQREEDAELRRRAEEHQLGIGEQRRKIDHRADADEEQQRKELRRDAHVEQPVQRALLEHLAVLLCNCSGHRQVHEDRAEAHGQQQRRFHVLLNCKIDEQPSQQPHDDLPPLKHFQCLQNRIHTFSPFPIKMGCVFLTE